MGKREQKDDFSVRDLHLWYN